MHAQASLYTSADHRCGHAKIYELQLDVWHLSLLYIGPYNIKHCCCDLVLYKASSENWGGEGGGNHTLIHMLVIKTRPKWKAPTAAGTARLSWDALWRPLAAVQEYQNDPPSLELQVSGFMPHHFPVSCISVCVCVLQVLPPSPRLTFSPKSLGPCRWTLSRWVSLHEVHSGGANW